MKKIALFGMFIVCGLYAQKLVVLDPAIVEMIYMLDSQDDIVAIAKPATSKIWPQEKTDKLKSVGTYSKPNLEKIVELRPDLVITSFHSIGVNEDLKRFNIKTMTLNAHSIDELYENIKTVGDITGSSAKAELIINTLRSNFKTYEGLEAKKAVAIFASTPLMAFNSDTLIGDVLKRFKVKNLADKLSGTTPIISLETILVDDPDFIIILGSVKEKESFVRSYPVLAKTKAFKNDKIIQIDSSLMLRGTPRIIYGINELYTKMVKQNAR